MKIYDYSQYVLGELELKDDAVPLIETEQDFEIGTCLKIFGELYESCIGGKEYLIVKKLGITDLDEEPEDEYDDNNVVCPYCHKHIQDSWELPDDDDDYECPYCGSHFSYERIISVTYESSPISPGEVIEL